MSAGRYDIKKLDRAATFSMKMIAKNDDGTYMELDGYTAKAAIKEHYDDVEVFLEFEATIPDPEHGEVLIALTPEQTLTLVECQYYYDVLLINGEYIMRLLDGTIQISPDVTQVGGESI